MSFGVQCVCEFQLMIIDMFAQTCLPGDDNWIFPRPDCFNDGAGPAMTKDNIRILHALDEFLHVEKSRTAACSLHGRCISILDEDVRRQYLQIDKSFDFVHEPDKGLKRIPECYKHLHRTLPLYSPLGKAAFSEAHW